MNLCIQYIRISILLLATVYSSVFAYPPTVDLRFSALARPPHIAPGPTESTTFMCTYVSKSCNAEYRLDGINTQVVVIVTNLHCTEPEKVFDMHPACK